MSIAVYSVYNTRYVTFRRYRFGAGTFQHRRFGAGRFGAAPKGDSAQNTMH